MDVQVDLDLDELSSSAEDIVYGAVDKALEAVDKFIGQI